jgi:hypothetical protein
VTKSWIAKGKLVRRDESREFGKSDTHAQVWVQERAGEGEYIDEVSVGFLSCFSACTSRRITMFGAVPERMAGTVRFQEKACG